MAGIQSTTCRFDGCGRAVLVVKHQLCQSHHKQLMAGEDLRPLRLTNTERSAKCSFGGCNYIARKDGLCSAHIAQRAAGLPLRSTKNRIPCEARDAQGNKWCFGCGCWKAEQEFSRSNGKKDGLQPRCKSCAKSVYNATHAEVRSANRKGKYGLTREAFDALLAAQGGACAICRSDSPGSRFWAVDHDHACCPGKTSCGNCVRGLLCGPCNVGLGCFRDSVQSLEAAALYLATSMVRGV